MKNYWIHLLAGCMTFAIGFASNPTVVDISETSQFRNLSATSPPFTAETRKDESRANQVRTINFSCKDEMIVPLWRLLRRDSVNREAENNFETCEELIRLNSLKDLNGDGRDELIFEGIHPFMNGMVGNWRVWFVQPSSTGYKILLEEHIRSYEIKSRSTGKYRDLRLTYKQDISSYDEMTFKFKGGKYVSTSCRHVNFGTTGIADIGPCEN